MAKLHIDLLAEQLTEGQLHSALEKLPEDLNEAYGSVIKRISAQNEKPRHLAKTALKWVTYAKEPLKAEELRHAIAVAPSSTDINEKDLIDIELLVSFCVGIVSIDREGGIIRLVHYTAQKYLEKELQSVQANTQIARTCLSYLAFDVFLVSCDDNPSLEERIRKYKLSSYAASHWGDHVREGLQEQLHALVLATFENKGKRDSMLQLFYGRSSSYHLSLLHLASSQGLANTCQILLSNWKRGNIMRRLINYYKRFTFTLSFAD